MAKLGDRARFTANDTVFHFGQREGKVGTIVLDADLEEGTNFGGLTCGWQPDGDNGIYITGLDELEIVK